MKTAKVTITVELAIPDEITQKQIEQFVEDLEIIPYDPTHKIEITSNAKVLIENG